jgi:hypothetical protein
MACGLKATLLCLSGSAVVCLLSVAVTRAQTAPADEPLMAEQVFKNVQVLKGIPVSEFMGTMGFIAASLSMNCTDCHVSDSSGSWARYADDTPVKQMTRRMIVMVNTINRMNFGSARMVTCYTCHRGSQRPKVTPSLAEQYGAPPPQDPDEIDLLDEATGPSAEQLLDRYIQAVGGLQRLDATRTVVAKGTYTGFDTDFDQVPVVVYARAPYQRNTVIQMRPPFAARISTYNGRAGWTAGADRPVPVLAMTDREMDAARLDAVALFFPASIKGIAKWRAGSREVTIDNLAVHMIEGTTPGGSRVKLYFDRQSGLLTRLVRYANTVLGLNPEHTEYSDYRDVSGTRLPFRWTVTWTNGQSTTELTDVQVNVPVDASRFSRPAVSVSR